MNDFRAESEELRAKELDAVKRVLHSGWYILGGELSQFEEKWAGVCGTNYAIGVGNGMDAIEIGLRSLGIGPGDEVITTPMTAFATVLAILRAGATPVLADINPKTALLDIASVARCISRRTKAILLVHLYGQLRDMRAWKNFCENHRVLLLEDCAQAHLAKSEEGFAGSVGVFGAYSFYPTKNLGAMGDAGALVTNNKALAEQAKKIRNYGQSERYHHPEIGMNSRMDEIQAALLDVRLGWLEEFTNSRKKIAKSYYQKIKNHKIQLLDTPEDSDSHVYHLFVVLCECREILASHLFSLGIHSFSHYPIPIHLQSSCLGIKIDPMGLSNAESHAERCLSIPCHPQMSSQDIKAVIDAINIF